MKLQDATSLLLELASQHGADGAEVVAGQSVGQQVEVLNGASDKTEQAEDLDLSLRLVHNKRQLVVSTNRFTKQALTDLFDRAWTMLPATPEVPDLVLTSADFWHVPTAEEIAVLEQSDGGDLPGLASLLEQALELEELGRADKRITRTDGVSADATRGSFLFRTLGGYELSYDYTYYSHGLSLIAGEGDKMTRGWDYSTKVWAEDLRSLKEVAERAIERTVAKQGAGYAKSGKFPVLFDKDVSRSLIGHFLGAINGEDIVSGTTFLKDSLNTQIFGDSISIVDDPFRPRGFGSRPVDGEGIRGEKRNLIENGVLTTWLLDLRTAGRLNMAPTGHAKRGGAMPHPGSNNVHILPGAKSREELMADMGTGLLITDLMGNAVNDITGDYSRGGEGFWVEGGKIVRPVKEATIAGTLQDIFRTMQPGSDLEFRGSTNAPSILVPQMDVSGK